MIYVPFWNTLVSDLHIFYSGSKCYFWPNKIFWCLYQILFAPWHMSGGCIFQIWAFLIVRKMIYVPFWNTLVSDLHIFVLQIFVGRVGFYWPRNTSIESQSHVVLWFLCHTWYEAQFEQVAEVPHLPPLGVHLLGDEPSALDIKCGT